jgi:hypothetical protein
VANRKICSLFEVRNHYVHTSNLMEWWGVQMEGRLEAG